MAYQPVQDGEFYVYALFREDGATPFYIGKGARARIHVHEKEAHRGTSHKDRIIQGMLSSGLKEIPKIKLLEGLTDKEAKQIEIDLIYLLLRWPNGPLANLTKGGDGVCGRSDESRAKTSSANARAWADPTVKEKRIAAMKAAWTAEKREAMRKRIEPYLLENRARGINKYFSAETRAKISEGRKFKNLSPKARDAIIKATTSPEACKKRNASIKEGWKNPEQRARRCEASKKSQSGPEYRAMRSEMLNARWQDPEFRKKVSKGHKDRYVRNPMSEERKVELRRQLDLARPKSVEANRRPEIRAKRIAAQKAAFATPEAKAKRSEASKKMWAAKKAHQYALEFPSAPQQLS